MKTNAFFILFLLMLNVDIGYAVEQKVEKKIDIIVYRSPTCSCCGKWIEHLKNNNFNVNDRVSDDVQAVKTRYGITKELASCHTAIVDNYVVEGHVPAKDILDLLKNKPAIVGLTVPGMPSGTPGMEMGGKKEAYQVISFDKSRKLNVFNTYQAE